jgi:lipoprotein-anchoring transpeptidase ErfK/SrfK
MITSLLSRIVMTSAGLSLMACGPVNIIAKGPSSPHRAEHVLYQWYDDGGPGELKVRIDLSEQQAFYTRGGRDVGWSFVATGKEGYGTPAGTYRISEKIVDKYSNRYGWIEDEWGNVTNGDATPGTRVPPGERYVPAPMPFWMRITSYGIGMHAGVIPKPGETASHGCIRLPKDFAPVLFDHVKVGTQVTIVH